jgi:translation initiation factor eIF-2B subunit delta
MPDSLQKALAGLRALAEDHRSGAAEIADRAAELLETYCVQARPPDPRLPYALAELADLTLRVQPSLAPLLNLANLVQLAAEGPRGRALSARQLHSKLRRWRAARQQAARRIARLLVKHLARSGRGQDIRVITFSYSSTVATALLAARSRLASVMVSEARPLLEGRTMAERLAAAGIEVSLVSDAALVGSLDHYDTVVVGADAVFADAYVNKIGTGILQERARRMNRPFYVLADTSKFLPPTLAAFHRIEEKPTHELWRGAPRGVKIVNRYFETIPLAGHVTLLSEGGPLRPAQAARLLRRIPVAQRWRELPPSGRPSRQDRKEGGA